MYTEGTMTRIIVGVMWLNLGITSCLTLSRTKNRPNITLIITSSTNNAKKSNKLYMSG